MTLAFPAEMPSQRFRRVVFELDYLQARAQSRGGIVQVAELGPAFWRASYETPPLMFADAEAWRAWMSSLRGGLRTMIMRDPSRARPSAYPAGFAALTRHGGGSFSAGTGIVTAINTARDEVTINTLPTSYAITAGDYLRTTVGVVPHLFRALETVTATAGALTVQVEPPLPGSVLVGATMHLADVYCQGVVVPGSGRADRRVDVGMIVTFDAVQTL